MDKCQHKLILVNLYLNSRCTCITKVTWIAIINDAITIDQTYANGIIASPELQLESNYHHSSKGRFLLTQLTI
jgi:hypothetical protein